jgi:hypothetical protein
MKFFAAEEAEDPALEEEVLSCVMLVLAFVAD